MPEFTARDTYAQWAMTLLALAATGISILGVVLIRRTFEETRRTADAAVRAANLAEAANRISERNTERESRPWLDIDLSVHGVEFEENGTTLKTTITVTNIGKTPAINVQVRPQIEVLNRPYEGVMRRQVFRISKVEEGDIDPLAATSRGMFPNKPEEMPWIFSYGRAPDAVRLPFMDGAINGGTDDAFCPMFHIAVAYKSMTSDQWLVTNQWFEVFEKTADGFRIIDPRNGRLSEDQILVRVADGGTYVK